MPPWPGAALNGRPELPEAGAGLKQALWRLQHLATQPLPCEAQPG